MGPEGEPVRVAVGVREAGGLGGCHVDLDGRERGSLEGDGVAFRRLLHAACVNEGHN